MRKKVYTVYNTPEYDEWFAKEPPRSQVQILGHLSHIQDEGYFGDHKDVRDDVWELRWKNGRSIYQRDARRLHPIIFDLGGDEWRPL